MHYEFEFRGGLNNNYGFETNLGIVYEVKFRPSNYLLGNQTTVYANHIYEFIDGFRKIAIENNENK